MSDYHDSMNAANFEAYFADVCKKLPANSVIVLEFSGRYRNSICILSNDMMSIVL